MMSHLDPSLDLLHGGACNAKNVCVISALMPTDSGVNSRSTSVLR